MRLPLFLWPEAHRRWVEERTIVYLAGDTTARLLAPRLGREPEPVTVQAIEIAQEYPATETEEQWAAEAVEDATSPSDPEAIALLAMWAHRHDPQARARWLDHLEAQAAAIIRLREGQIRELADLLGETPVLSAVAVAELVK